MSPFGQCACCQRVAISYVPIAPLAAKPLSSTSARASAVSFSSMASISSTLISAIRLTIEHTDFAAASVSAYVFASRGAGLTVR